ncbi:MAG: class I SAM-dependent methyltransferase [Nanoarchaeota archaeon]|nr:class I SAM-dependent methyltransferase [Nanoarchaeota archaeon]
MSLRKFSNLREISVLFRDYVVPKIGKRHLDFGCGSGFGTVIEALERPDSKIIGYDTNQSIVSRALEFDLDNLGFTFSKTNLEKFQFDSASANFVLHEDINILAELHSLLLPGAIVCVLDYNLKGSSSRRFRKSFCSDNERRVMKREGLRACYEKHTALGVGDCVRIGASTGFENVLAHASENYFVWVGKVN